MRSFLGAMVVSSASVLNMTAQQILEVDIDAGRELAGGPEYVFDARGASVDYGRRLVLAAEIVDPLVVRAYSLEDGSVQGAFGKSQPGDGPGELASVYETAVGPDGVFVSGPGKVLYWSWSGALLHEWSPAAPMTHRLCSLDGRPAVALQEGVMFRDDDGEDVALGGEARRWLRPARLTRAASAAAMDHYVSVRLACAGSSAYVLAGMDHVLTEYRQGADPRVVPMPAELVDVASEIFEVTSRAWGYGEMFLADDGRLVITARTNNELARAVVDPETGCYALLKQRRTVSSLTYVGMFADSVVVFESSREPTVTVIDGRQVAVYSTEASYIFVRPVRPVSGEPCS